MFSQFQFRLPVITASLALLNAMIACCSPSVSLCAQSDHKLVFDQSLAEWKQCAKDATIACQKFLICDADEADGFRQDWIHAIERGRDKFKTLIDVCIQRLKSESVADQSSLAFIFLAMEFHFEAGDYEAAHQLGETIRGVAPNMAILLGKLALCSFATNRFDECRDLIEKINQLGIPITPDLAKIAATVDAQIISWKHESELRKAEAKADDLPQVEMMIEQFGTTEKVTLELFENEAPNAVANFISLVDQGFYADRAFFRVVSHVDATGGCPNDDGTGTPNYLIASEFSRPGARKHFRGSLGMVNLDQSGKEGSQFYILLTPNPTLDGRSTVFGRVLEGMSIFDRLNRTHFTDETQNTLKPIPDIVLARIQSARVLRKRDHEYSVTTIKE